MDVYKAEEISSRREKETREIEREGGERGRKKGRRDNGTARADVYRGAEIHFPYRFGFQCCVWLAASACVAYLYSSVRAIERHNVGKQN